MDIWLLKRIRAVSLRRVVAWGLGLVLWVLWSTSLVSQARWSGVILSSLVLVFLIFRFAVPAWKHFRNPTAHPLVGRAASWGDLPVVAMEAERAFTHPRYKGGDGWKVGDTYLVRSTLFRLEVLRLEDLSWAYKKVTTHRVNLLPVAKTHQAILMFPDARAVIPGGKNRVDEILSFVQQRVPWAAFGYSRELVKHFEKRTPEFLRAVEERRAQWKQQERLAPRRPPAAPALVDVATLRAGLRSPDPGVRERSASTLGDRGAAAFEALPELEQLLRDPVRQVRMRAKWAIETIQRKHAAER